MTRDATENSSKQRIKGIEPRRNACEVISLILAGRKTLKQYYASPTTRYAAMTLQDRALSRALVGTALRHHRQIEAMLTRCLERPLPDQRFLQAILMVAIAQIFFMRVQGHAAVHVAVGLCRGKLAPYRGLVNAILRRMSRDRTEFENIAEKTPIAPAALNARWRRTFTDAESGRLARICATEPALDLNFPKDAEYWCKQLGATPIFRSIGRLAHHGPTLSLPGFEDGKFWVQNVAASLPALLLNVKLGEQVLDMCAAPGGKTAQLVQMGARVTAIDSHPGRIKLLRQNLARLGMDAHTICADARSWQPPAALFDRVLLDAPCSATGTVRRHPDIGLRWRDENLASLNHLQLALLASAVGALKAGGTLVYAVCSLEPVEGEWLIEQFSQSMLGRQMQPLPVKPDELDNLAICYQRDGSVRTYPFHLPHDEPQLAGMDGFYIARFQKISQAPEAPV